jgi:protein-tyrosine-phosphatase
MAKRILFKCKGNICRSPAAELILKAHRPDWQVFSCATTPHCIGDVMHPEMRSALKWFGYAANRQRPVIYQDWILERMKFFDEIHDLHEAGISDPYRTGDFKETTLELMTYITNNILGDEDDQDKSKG